MDFPKHFDFKKRETEIFQNWEQQGYFKARVNPDKKPFTIMMAPPNITGQLHMGHALDNTLPDCLIRFKRMQGYEALWQPGCDHAAIATETKIVAALKEEGIDKDELGREGFLERAWQWKDAYQNRIMTQLRRLGTSCDFSRERFTMDEGLSKAVQEVFIRYYNEQLIYRGERMINWCPTCKTSISDAEVTYEEQDSFLWEIRYPLVNGEGELVVATTRPETLLGDTALAVHPDDERYQHLIGQEVELPLCHRNIPIIADRYVEPEFGTGVVKMTPAHDPNDFEVGQRHDLPIINVLNDDATVNEAGGAYQGLSREAARAKIAEDLETQGYLVGKKPFKHNVGVCYRCFSTIEPRLSMQWFVDMERLAKQALDAVKEGKTRFIPERFSKIYYNWLENIRDWCISRQLWWGHRIPAYYCDQCGTLHVGDQSPERCTGCGHEHFTQDPDTLDTWFSSALWPFSTLGWPDQTEDLNYFYPTDVLVTGYDIIFFWVARMMFQAIELTGKVPFKEVYIHGLIRDSQGRKMSKSLGNGIDPLEVIDAYGADAFRYALVSGTAPGNDQRYEDGKLQAGRALITKLWNAFRFMLPHLDVTRPFDEKVRPKLELVEDRWIYSRLNCMVEEVTQNLEHFDLGVALDKLVLFLREEFCDWYIEMCKPRLFNEVAEHRDTAVYLLRYSFSVLLRLLHPFMPFVTEEIWIHAYGKDQGGAESIMISAWPEVDENAFDAEAEDQMSIFMEAVRRLRNVRAEYQVEPKREISLEIADHAQVNPELFIQKAPELKRLANVSRVEIKALSDIDQNQAKAIALPGLELYVPMADLVDQEAEREKLQAEIKRLEGLIQGQEKKLSNEQFVSRAPQHVVQAERDKLEDYQNLLETAKRRLAQ